MKTLLITTFSLISGQSLPDVYFRFQDVEVKYLSFSSERIWRYQQRVQWNPSILMAVPVGCSRYAGGGVAFMNGLLGISANLYQKTKHLRPKSRTNGFMRTHSCLVSCSASFIVCCSETWAYRMLERIRVVCGSMTLTWNWDIFLSLLHQLAHHHDRLTQMGLERLWSSTRKIN